MSEELNKIDEIEKKYSEERKLTEDIAEEILSEEIRHCLKTNAFDEAGNYQEILNILKKENGMISDLNWKQFKLLKTLWQQKLRNLAVKEYREQEPAEERSEKVTVEIEAVEEAAKKAANTEDKYEEGQVNGDGAA